MERNVGVKHNACLKLPLAEAYLSKSENGVGTKIVVWVEMYEILRCRTHAESLEMSNTTNNEAA